MATVANIHTNFHTTVEFDDLLTAVTERALAKFPEARGRIERGAALVRADAVEDLTRLRPHWFTVASGTHAGRHYDVVSNGTTVCNCVDYERHATADNGFWCKHGWAALLTRALRREVNTPRARHAEHYYLGAGYAVQRTQDTVEFWPGGRGRSVVCGMDALTAFGKVVEPPVWR